MDGTAGDGADSAEDSGTSQPYPATLPGIPKASYLICFYFFIIFPLPPSHTGHPSSFLVVNMSSGPPLSVF